MKHSLLCIDDEPDNVEALERLFRKKYQVFKATSGQAALEILAKQSVTVIISDQRMPQMTGVEVLAQSLKTHPDAIRILLTGYTDIDSVISAINSGQIYRYVTKPWDPVDLANAVDRAVERYELGAELKEKNRDLAAALEQLKTLDQAKTEFMLLVNHELKTPLTAILSFSDLLRETPLSDDQNRYLTRIKSSALRLQEMVMDSLELISAQTELTKVHHAPLGVTSLAQPIPDFITQIAQKRGVSFKVELENQTVLADEKLTRNVIRRLLHNAAKFAHAGTEIQVRGASQESEYVFEIENAGDAIGSERISHLMKPFTLNEKALNHSSGTGLGLSLSQALLKLQGSQLILASQGGKISAKFALPVVRPPDKV